MSSPSLGPLVSPCRGERVAAVQAVQHAAQHAAFITPATLPASTLRWVPLCACCLLRHAAFRATLPAAPAAWCTR